MHTFKRIYLLGTIVVSLSIPFITFTTYIITEVSNVIADIPTEINGVITTTPTNYIQMLLWTIYGLGVLIFGIKFTLNLFSIINKVRQNPKQKVQNFTHVLLQKLTAPHTFFNYLFLNKAKYMANLIPKEVLWHEQTHAKEKHSLDILFIEVLHVVFWFNPLFYYLKKSIKLNHEFLADRAVLNKGVSLTAYQEVLLAFSSNLTEPQLANAINYSSIKKRFTIMKTNTSKKSIWIRSLMFLPLLSILIYSFSNKVMVQKESVTAKNILIQVSKDKKILLNRDQSVTIETLATEIKKIVKNYPEQLSNVKATIEAHGSIKMGFIIDIEQEITKSGISYRSLIPQQKATPEQIAEYNTLAKYYNSQPIDKKTLKFKDMKRIKYLYDLMTDDQKKNNEPLPNFPPPPAPIPVAKEGESPQMAISKTFYNYKDEDGKEVNVELIHDGLQLVPAIPPPPPIPASATDAQKKSYKAAIQKYEEKKSQQIEKFNNELEKIKNGTAKNHDNKSGSFLIKGKTYYYKTKDGITKYYDKYGNEVDRNSGNPLPPLPPLSPPNPIDQMIELAKKGANFYYNGKKINSDKAIDIVKNNEDINIQIRENNTEVPIVKLSTKPYRN